MIKLVTTICIAVVLVVTGVTSKGQNFSLEQLFKLTNSNKKTSSDLQKHYHNLLYTQLVQCNDAAQYQRFITMFPNSSYTPAIAQLLHQNLYNYALSYDAIHSLQKYTQLYPTTSYAIQAQQKHDALVFDSYKLNYSIPSLKKFITENPNNTMLATAYEKLYALYITNYNVYAGSLKFVTEVPNATNAPMAWNALFTNYTHNYNADSIAKFIQEHNKYKGTINLNAILALAQLKLIPKQDSSTKLWGYIDEKSQWNIIPQYLKTEDFNEGYAVVETATGSNYINKQGQKMLAHDVEECNAFNHGIAIITINGNDGAINNTLATVLPCNYRYLSTYDGTCIKAQINNGLYGVLNTDEEWILQPIYKTIEELNVVLNKLQNN